MARTEVQLTALGHAGLRLDSPSLRLVMDPWFSRKGAFQASWFQFPSSDHLDVQAVLDCDWIALSHQHLDHMDFSALAQRSPRVRVAIPKYASSQLRQRLERGGLHNVVEVAAWTCLRLNDSGDWLTFIPEESPMCEDSAMLVSAGGVSVLNVNDARPSLAQLRRAAFEAGGSLDVMAIQVASATWHPICYEYPPDVAARLSAEKRLAKFKSISRLVRLVRP